MNEKPPIVIETKTDADFQKQYDTAYNAGRNDGWSSAVTGVGLRSRDKSLATGFCVDILSREELENLIRGDDVAARIVEKIPKDMLREGFEVLIQPSEDQEQTPPATPAPTDVIPPPPKASGGSSTMDAASTAMTQRPGPDPALEMAMRALTAAPSPGIVKRAAEDVKAQSEALADKFKELKVHERLLKALCYKRGFGGGGVLIGANDGETDLRKPLNLENIRSVDWLTALTNRELYPTRYYSDPRSASYGEPELFRIQPEAWTAGPGQEINAELVEVHESRLLKFVGIQVSKRHVLEQRGWGDSVLVRCNRVISQFQLSWGSAAVLLSDFAQGVFKMEGLAEAILTNQSGLIQNRIAAMDLARSVLRAVVIDKEEDFQRQSTPIAGMGDLLDRFCNRLAAAAEMPVTMLMGEAPAGLNATGDSDIRNYYDNIGALQISDLKPAIEYLAKIVFLSKEGPTGGVEPDLWSVKFHPLWRLTEKEKTEVRNTQAKTDEIYISCSVLTPEEVAGSRFGGDEYSTETTIDFELRKQMASKAEADKQLAQAQVVKASQTPPQAPPAPKEGV